MELVDQETPSLEIESMTNPESKKWLASSKYYWK